MEAIRRSLQDNKKEEENNEDNNTQVTEEVCEEKNMEDDVATEHETSEAAAVNDAAAAAEGKDPEDEEGAQAAVDNTFASDAEGNGEIAAVLGETLDKVARAIDDMNLELNRSPSSEGRYAGEDSDDEPEIVVDIKLKEGEQGATIIDGLKDDESHGSWSVVNDEQQIASDEALARAAQVIGSAMFESDMSRPHADAPGDSQSVGSSSSSESSGSSSSSSSSSTSFSSVTSVPTTLPSVSTEQHVPAAQLQRWAIQLGQLHELGFDNEALCVDILERLNAANIGVDSTDEVSVTHVVDELMKDW